MRLNLKKCPEKYVFAKKNYFLDIHIWELDLQILFYVL